METLLRIDSSPRSARSHSRKLTERFARAWISRHPNGRIVHRDLGADPPPPVSEEWIAAAFSDPAEHDTARRAAIAVSDELVDELIAADELVIGAPMYNYSVSAVLKAWIDQVVRVGRTVEYPSYRGLLGGRKATIVSTRGGSGMNPGEALAELDAQVPYLVQILGFIGIEEVSVVYAGNLAGPETERERSLAEAMARVDSLVSGA